MAYVLCDCGGVVLSQVEKEEQAKQEQQLEQGQDWQSTAPAKDQWVDTTGESAKS